MTSEYHMAKFSSLRHLRASWVSPDCGGDGCVYGEMSRGDGRPQVVSREREREDDVLTLEMDNGILPFK